MPSTATQASERLNRQWEDESSNLVASHGDVACHVEDESADAGSSILAEYTSSGGDNTLKGMTNFSAPELDALWALVERSVMIVWTQGRGGKPSVSGKDALFITLTVLKHFDTWQKHAIDFNMGVSTLENMMYRVIQTVEPVLYTQLVKRVKMSEQMEAGNTFTNYPHALYATDVKFQPVYRPCGRFTEQKMLRKEDGSSPEIGAEPTQFPNMWAILVDKGYQGAGQVLRTIQPKKQPCGGTLDRDDIARNRAVSADRVLVKNFFGRMCMLWKATYATFK
ncbi:hypothetical protein F444_05941 [Phytophthora nicotianae P1976]|uniref:DDE Tnp4 domain-containing protein n=1 Tax=Phytophthora nicotianae P1976 TaxID=1317066 RepID=A0A081AKC6_PHYNI|nr:hypothetical protein F444_05941 [Phytophthora nicotianae P1976]